MKKTMATRYDFAEHLRTPEKMAAYLEAFFEEGNGDAAFIAKALGDIARAKGMTQPAYPGKAFIRHSPVKEVQALIPSLKL
jgi:DNA-binding phage protein